MATNFDDLEIIDSPDQQSDIEPIAEGSLLQKPVAPPPTPTPVAFKIQERKPLLTASRIFQPITESRPYQEGVLPLLGAASQASKGFGSTMEAAGELGVGALADLGQNIVSPSEGYHTENVQTALQNPIIETPERKGEPRFTLDPSGRFPIPVPHTIPAQTKEELPTFADVRAAPGALRIPASAAQGLVKSLPQLAATAAGGEVVGPMAAAGAVFGSTPQGFDPKSAAVAAALPFAGKYSGEIAGAIAKQFGVEEPVALNWIKGVAGTAGPASGLIAEQEIEISKLPPEQQHEARVNMWANIAGQVALGPMGVEFERPGAPRGPEKIPVTFREIQKEPAKAPALPEIKPGEFYALHQQATPFVRSLRAQSGERVSEVPTKEGGEAARSGGGEESGARAGEVRGTPDTAKSEIARYSGMDPEQFSQTIKDEKIGVTSMAYRMAEKMTAADIPALEEAQKQAHAERRSIVPEKGATIEQMQRGVSAGMKGQMFGEAIKWRKALDEAQATGAKSLEDFSALEKKYGVGESVRGGQDLKAAFERQAAPESPVINLDEAAAELRKQPGREFAPAIRDASGKVTEGTSHDELRRSGITGTPGFTDAEGNFLTATDVARRKMKGGVPGEEAKKEGSKVLSSEQAFGLLREEGVTAEDAKGLLSGNKTVEQVVGGNFKVTPSRVVGEEQGHDEAFMEGYNQAIERLTDIVDRSKSPQPSMAGPGGTVPGDVGDKAELAQLTDALKTMAEQGKGKPQLKRAYSLGEQLQQMKAPVLKAITGLKAAGQSVKLNLTQPTRWTGFKNALGERQLALSESTLNLRDFVEKGNRAVPSALDREAITNYIDNGGDRTKILRALAETDPRYEKGYEQALKLTPEQITLAENTRNYFESRLQDAIDAGILENGVEEYIHRTYEKDSPWKSGIIAELRSGVFTGKPALAKQRIFEYDYEAEKAGYKPEKDFIKRVAAYDYSLNKAIADRKFVRDLMSWIMPDGRPAIDVGGRADKVGGVGTDAAFLIKPQYRPRLEAKPGMSAADAEKARLNNRGDYIAYDHPALRKWKWVSEDAEGSPILVQGDVLVHKDAIRDPNNPLNQPIPAVFGKSAIREFKPFGIAVGRGALQGSSIVKQTMLDLSGFHPVQITVHGWEHRADVPLTRWTAQMTGRNFKPIDLNDPVQRSLVSHGLNVVDYNGLESFSEGVSGGGSSLFRHLPYVGGKLQEYNHWLFQDYIPRLKMEMATHALERNRAAYAKDLRSGKMTEDQLLHLTANQANAAFGELNYEMMGRNKTLQDGLRLALLAPDFLEARGRFAGQAAKSLVGGYGREQLTALAFGAVTLYVTARLMNKISSGEWHFEPEHAFDVMHNGRAYSLRTVQGDIIHAAFNPRSFTYTRLNPVTTRTIFEGFSGRDQFGRPRSPLDQVKDFAGTIVPISFRGLTRPREQKWWEGFLNSIGVTERRATASDSIYKIAGDFKKKHGIQEPGEFIYDPEKDPYRATKLALMFDNPQTAAQEMKLAVDKGATDWKHLGAYFNQFGKRPFTGSKASEREFWNTLSPDQQKLYKDAVNERIKMRQNAAEAFRILRQEREQNP